MESAKDNLPYPVVGKIISDDVLHKTDAGGVKINIQNSKELEEACEEILSSVKKNIPDAHIEGILVEEMIQDDGLEMFIGVKEDPEFGSLIVCGLGGIFIEVLKDVSIRKVPINRDEAYAMLRELKGYPMLEGVRGENHKDIHALTEALVRISEFASHYNGKIQEMDINPIRVFEEGKGIAALDGIIIWKDDAKSSTYVDSI